MGLISAAVLAAPQAVRGYDGNFQGVVQARSCGPRPRWGKPRRCIWPSDRSLRRWSCYNARMTITIRSSSQQALKDRALLQRELDAGHVVELADLNGAVLVRPEDVIALADQIAEEELLEEMVTYRKNVTGVDNTIFISPRGKTRHAARVKVAIDPPDAVDPRGNVAVIAVADGRVVHGDIEPRLLRQVQQFIELNRDLLIDYWNAYDTKVDTEDLRQRLKKIP